MVEEVRISKVVLPSVDNEENDRCFGRNGEDSIHGETGSIMALCNDIGSQEWMCRKTKTNLENDQGLKKCRYKYVEKYSVSDNNDSTSFVCIEPKGNRKHGLSNETDVMESPISSGRLVDPHDINMKESPRLEFDPCRAKLKHVLLEKTETIDKSFQKFTGVSNANVMSANGSVKSIKDWAAKAKLDDRQRRAFEILTASFILTFHRRAEDSPFGKSANMRYTRANKDYLNMENDALRKLIEYEKKNTEQLICMIHGPGGCGKSTVINLVIEYARDYCQMLECGFSSQTIVVTAMSGVGATLINGETIHRAVGLGKKKLPEPEECEGWEVTRLIIIDEISFADRKDIINLNVRLGQLMKDPEAKYGGVNIVFSGDFRQLSPVRGKPLYMGQKCVQFESWINCFIELEGMHRFRKDPEYGLLLRRFRDGSLTMADIDTLSSRIVNEKSKIPVDTTVGCFRNQERCWINKSIFERLVTNMYKEKMHTKAAAMIFSDELQLRIFSSNGDVRDVIQCGEHLWGNHGEEDTIIKRMMCRQWPQNYDPVLRLYEGCPVTLTQNIAVKNGKARGSTATVNRIVLKHGVTPRTFFVNNIIPVMAVLAGEVERIELYHSNDQIQDRLFTLSPSKFWFNVEVEANKVDRIRVSCLQFPIRVNVATIVHQLQGRSVNSIYVPKWTYANNWVYAVLSSIKDMKSLHCREALKKNLNYYAVPEDLTTMLKRLRRKSPCYKT